MLLELTKVEQRYEAVMEVLRDGLGVTEVAERYGVSRQIVHRWIRRYEIAGLAGLGDRSHRPAGCPHQMVVEIEARICELRRLHPDWGPRRLGHELARDGIDPVPSRSSIYRALLRNNLVEPAQRRRRRADYRRWERGRPMELWQMDVMGVLIGGQKHNLITGIDDHSRFCVVACLAERANHKAVCRAFAEAMGRYGVPDEVLTDNGKVFTGRFNKFGGEVLFDRICRENGITHLLTGVRAPTTTGKIERFHKTLRLELFSRTRFETMKEAQAALDAYVEAYNHDRPHQGVGMLTPAQRFSKAPVRPKQQDLLPKKRPDVSPSVFSPNEVRRRAWANGIICVGYQRFSVGRALAGQVVTVRIESRVLHVFYEGQLVKSVPKRMTKEVTQFRAHKPHDHKKAV